MIRLLPVTARRSARFLLPSWSQSPLLIGGVTDTPARRFDLLRCDGVVSQRPSRELFYRCLLVAAITSFYGLFSESCRQHAEVGEAARVLVQFEISTSSVAGTSMQTHVPLSRFGRRPTREGPLP